jgi:hypothetical protein
LVADPETLTGVGYRLRRGAAGLVAVREAFADTYSSKIYGNLITQHPGYMKEIAVLVKIRVKNTPNRELKCEFLRS